MPIQIDIRKAPFYSWRKQGGFLSKKSKKIKYKKIK